MVPDVVRQAFCKSFWMAATGLAIALAGCDKKPEPGPGPGSSAAPLSASARLTEKERDRERRLRNQTINPEMCSIAIKKWNTLNGRAETDHKGAEWLTKCYARGNAAWYRCMVSATDGAGANKCMELLAPPE